VRLYGHLPLVDFGPRALRGLLAAVVAGTWLTEEERARRERLGNPTCWSRRYANRHLGRIKHVWRWGAAEELLPAPAWQAIAAVQGLRAGELGVRDRAEVPPVSEDVLEQSLAAMNPVAAALVELLGLTAARPSEVLAVCWQDINTTGAVEVARGFRVGLGAVWAIQPRAHKTAHRGERVA
jgi:integrase